MSRSLKFYIGVIAVILAYFSYASWNGITFWEDKVERNTEYNSNRSHSGYGTRFYHK